MSDRPARRQRRKGDRAGADWRLRAVTAEEAVRSIGPGEHVFVGSACATPRRLLRALEALDPPPAGIQLIHFLTDGATGEGGRNPFRHRAFYIGQDMRKLATSARVDYVPISLAEVPRLVARGRLTFDTALLQVSPPNRAGMCSLGVSVDISRVAALSARRIIAEVNPHMPRTGAKSEIPIARIDQLVAVDDPVIEYLQEPLGPAAERIASKRCATPRCGPAGGSRCGRRGPAMRPRRKTSSSIFAPKTCARASSAICGR